MTKALIDGPITDGELGPVLPLGLLALGLGVLEAALVFWRRWVQSSAVLSVETEMRRDLYAHLQLLPMSFHSKWQSGQLLSRATTDLSAIRRFSGFGLLFLVINILQVTVVTIVLLHMYWPLGPGGGREPRRPSCGSRCVSRSPTSWSPAGCRTSRVTWPRGRRRVRSASG